MEELRPSSSCELGRKEYWSEFYSTELENFEDYGDIGDIWFGKKNLERIVKWLDKNKVDKCLPILDVGCGNGRTLISLFKVGYEDLTGIDFAEEAILLAKKIAQNKNMKINLEVLDFLKEDIKSSSMFCKKEFHVIIDKGTYDAIGLDVEHVEEKRKQYINQILNLLSSNGYFLLFSCNWTKEELLFHFKEFTLHEEIEIPSIGFGGKVGQTVTALIMKKCTFLQDEDFV
ncbi:EEF1A lysine methyltransferase 2 [Trichonephila clavata]|uniref:Protein-lysine N-methyltransferase TNCT_719251 n=1 Tax=Trichonephila clavata TaxID=2740835 RepID=A0A8X6FB63_TRICU|nr:EEF1A lysine methyltransferase 2 [Trichonephila clavata]